MLISAILNHGCVFIIIYLNVIDKYLQVITKFVNILDTMFNKFWWATLIFILILVALVIAESEFFKGLRKEAKKEKLERAEESTEALGEVSEEVLEDMGS